MDAQLAGARRAVLTLVALAALVVPAAASADQTPAQIIAAFNAERTANGLPAGVTEDATWSSGCQAHDEYGVLNGGWDSGNPHGETAGNPGYSDAGVVAGGSSVLASGSSWDHGNPWEQAPWHFLDMMRPDIAVTGADEHGGFDCLWVADASRPAAAADTLYGAVPGGPSASLWAEQVHDEWPSSPGDAVGLPEGHDGPGSGTITGPDVVVYWDGPSGAGDPALTDLTAASVTGPDGPVDVSVIGHQDTAMAWPQTGVVLPRSPLQPGTDYTVSATFSTPDGTTPARSWTGTFSFHTAPKVEADQQVHFSDLDVSGGQGHVTLGFDWPVAGRDGTIAITSTYGVGGSGPMSLDDGTVFTFPAPGAGQSITFTVTTPAFTVGSVSYASKTVSRTYDGPPASDPAGGGGTSGTTSGTSGTTSGSGSTLGGGITLTGGTGGSAGTGGSSGAGSSPAGGPPAGGVGAITMKAVQRGQSVRATAVIAPDRSRVKEDLVGPGGVVLGHATQAHVPAGVLSFQVPLNFKGRKAMRLSRRHRLTLMLRITVIPPHHGAVGVVTRRVVLRAA